MFTGIIESVGKIESIEMRGGDCRLKIATGKLDMSDVQLGDSIACNGVCLTAIEFNSNYYVADVSAESLKLTTLGYLKIGTVVNLEKALTPTTRLGGHLVSGHVDGLGVIVEIKNEARSIQYRIRSPSSLSKYIARKGSITVDGVSLTVNEVEGNDFWLNLVPHTVQETTSKNYKVGSKVNLEVDLLARYLERLLMSRQDEIEKSNLDYQMLMKNGFIK